MSKKSKNAAYLGLVLGILGVVSGMALLFLGQWLIGILGSISSAGLAYMGYRDFKAFKNSD